MGNTLTKKNDYIKHIVIAGVLTAFSLIIPLLPFAASAAAVQRDICRACANPAGDVF